MEVKNPLNSAEILSTRKKSERNRVQKYHYINGSWYKINTFPSFEEEAIGYIQCDNVTQTANWMISYLLKA